MRHVIVIGGGQAGASLVARLRGRGFDGRITLVCGETSPPYQRPPLSKAYLLGRLEKERLFLRPAAFYEENGIELRLGQMAERIEPAARRVRVGGDWLAYDALVLATGAAPRRLPEAMGGTLGGVHVLRDLEDVDGMRASFVEGRRALIVGGGYIGLEAAAAARMNGMTVTLVETAERILRRVAAPQTSDYFRALHERNGVDLREGAGLDRLETAQGAVSGGAVAAARLSDGARIEVDLALVGIGVSARDALARSAGIETGPAPSGGIVVDALGRSSAPGVWAAGDCTLLPHEGEMIRLESVQNAIDQAEAVADNIMGADTPYVPRPWFWSDQYDVKLQIAGLGTNADRIVVREGAAPAQRSHWYFRGKRLIAVDAMNDARGYMIGKRLIEADRSPDPDLVADPGVDLKALLAS
ncbi:NAD(P)/FAD-dependent oxidoreductase [Profundibacterium mesophilum]|uniref:Ferredoxin--NAD+ reductase n=1 Tax=Profundibacterium mesophilum KAUST100406-0324 TaxID=1037889 RepID=A0A921NV95_9RHOB|nr:FAD-dependent oxidoreductase [Profundibacterium mesophilum]KAF0677314.1 ferredoxin--NAD+ reductase [Profundibacterium mesophilum KAUST100406-0324]